MDPENQEDELQNDVEAMNKSFGDIIVAEPEPETPPEEPGEGDSVPPTELEAEPEAQPQEPEPDPDSDAEPDSEPVILDPIEDKDKIIEELRTKLAEKEVKSIPEPEPEPEPEPAPITLEDQDFLGDIDPEDLVRDSTEFNKMLNKVFHQGIDTARKVLGEGVLRAIPDIVKANIVSMSNLQKASEKFYKENKDLEPFKRVVGTVFEEIASDNPGKSYSELLPLVGTEVRDRLELHKKAVDNTNPKPPRLPRKKSRSIIPNDQPNTDPLMSELDQMSKSLENN